MNPVYHRTRMTRISQIFTDMSASVQSVCYGNPSAFICVHLRLIFVSLSDIIQAIQFNLFHSCLNLLKNKPQINADERRFVNLNIQRLSEIYQKNNLIKLSKNTQRAQSTAEVVFASFALFAVRFMNNLNELSSSSQSSAILFLKTLMVDATQ